MTKRLHVLQDGLGVITGVITLAVSNVPNAKLKEFRLSLLQAAGKAGLADPARILSTCPVAASAESPERSGIPAMTIFRGPAGPGQLAGRVIVKVEEIPDSVCNTHDWMDPGDFQLPLAIWLDDGMILYSPSDGEGSRPGILSGKLLDGKTFSLTTNRE